MASLNLRQKFDPLDLEIIDRVYDVARAYIEARDLYRDTTKDPQEEDVLRKQGSPSPVALPSISTPCASEYCRASINIGRCHARFNQAYYKKPECAALLGHHDLICLVH